jgi:enoyl-CoA hydratase/carnithine racemase
VETLAVTREDGVVTVTLNRPARKNALTRSMVGELTAVLEEVNRRLNDRVLVMCGAGGDFCSGADLTDSEGPGSPEGASAVDLVRRVGDMAVALHRLTKPSIAKVDGVAVGAGLGLALGCDLVVASERARFSMIFIRRALSPDAGTSWLLPRLVGMAKAKELALFGDVLDAREAVRLGLLNVVVPVEDLDGFVEGWARRLAAGAPLAQSMTKSLLAESWSVSLLDAVEHEAHCQAVNLAGPDIEEALAAFAEKREPRFVSGER